MSRMLEELRERAEKAREKNKERLHKHYHYARSLGFSSAEAAVLQSRTIKYIDQMVKEKANG